MRLSLLGPFLRRKERKRTIIVTSTTSMEKLFIRLLSDECYACLELVSYRVSSTIKWCEQVGSCIGNGRKEKIFQLENGKE